MLSYGIRCTALYNLASTTISGNDFSISGKHHSEMILIHSNTVLRAQCFDKSHYLSLL